MHFILYSFLFRFFSKHPEAQPLFASHGGDDLDSVEFRSHALRVAAGLGTLINLAMDTATFQEQIEWLGEFHAKIEGMRADFFLVSLMSQLHLLLQRAWLCV